MEEQSRTLPGGSRGIGVAVVTVVTGSDDDGSTDTREELKMTGVNCLEFTMD